MPPTDAARLYGDTVRSARDRVRHGPDPSQCPAGAGVRGGELVQTHCGRVTHEPLSGGTQAKSGKTADPFRRRHHSGQEPPDY
jgi:hypothetical protein